MNNIYETPRIIENNLFQYINEVNKIPVLTEEEELYHSKEKDKGNINSAKILVSSYLRLVVKIANSYKNYGIPVMDLISEGNIGLMRAVKTFDWKKGFKLATYSIWWIKAYIQEYILKTWSIVKIGTSAIQKKLFFNLKKIKNNILLYTDRKNLNNEDIKQISNTFNVSREDIIDMDARLSKNDLYLNNKVSNEDEETEVVDLIPSKLPLQDAIINNKREKSKKYKLFQEAFTTLNDREKEIITLRKLNDNPLTLAEISKKYNISGERARQIEAKAIEKLKKYISEKLS